MLLEKQLRAQHLVGMAAIVFRSHTIIGIANAGVKRQGEITPIAATDLFHLGSNTKAITATMIARLVEAGKLSWTTTQPEIWPTVAFTSRGHSAVFDGEHTKSAIKA